MGERWHPDLASASVIHLGVNRLLFEVLSKVQRSKDWEIILKRNYWYQDKILARAKNSLIRKKPGIFFSYSYSALNLLTWLRNRGWRIVIGQMDPGKFEEDIVAKEESTFPDFNSFQKRAPSNYWASWKQEMDLAELIMVNSDWSKEALLEQGLPEAKIKVVPLAYGDRVEKQMPDSSPARFSKERPLKVLFLGQINLRKGVHYLLNAMEFLKDLPVIVDFVGPIFVDIPQRYTPLSVTFHGPVSRASAEKFYANADIFILPTLSDGFAITQLEALGKGLPLIVSRNCAQLVKHGYNGYLLDTVNQESISKALTYCIENPKEIELWAQNSKVPDTCSMASVGQHLSEIDTFLSAEKPRTAGSL
ncbi:MAG: glycosyltransferase family 4 protein [Verrucomicrobia bacterium]|nr:glycosyltransferase family 4 protein [Verrucomicrobiota bacterium]